VSRLESVEAARQERCRALGANGASPAPQLVADTKWAGRCGGRPLMSTAKTVTGFVLLGTGVAMLALPGPGWLTIVAGLAMLAGEFPWARRLLDRVRDTVKRLRPSAKP
jgi:Putative transmembrane protein (PGPGW)